MRTAQGCSSIWPATCAGGRSRNQRLVVDVPGGGHLRLPGERERPREPPAAADDDACPSRSSCGAISLHVPASGTLGGAVLWAVCAHPSARHWPSVGRRWGKGRWKSPVVLDWQTACQERGATIPNAVPCVGGGSSAAASSCPPADPPRAARPREAVA